MYRKVVTNENLNYYREDKKKKKLQLKVKYIIKNQIPHYCCKT